MLIFGNATEAVLGIIVLIYKSMDIISLIFIVLIYRKIRTLENDINLIKSHRDAME